MRDDYYCLAVTVAKVEEELVDFRLGSRIQVSRGLIRKEDGGVIYQGAGNGYALLFAARKLGRFMACTAFQSHF